MTYDWDSKKEAILELYQKQGKPLHEVMKIMKDVYNFTPSVRAYRSRLKRWHITKYIPRGQSQRERSNRIQHAAAPAPAASATLMTPSASVESTVGVSWSMALPPPVVESHPWVPATPRTNSGSPIIAATNTIDKLQVYSPSVGPSSVLQMPHPGPSIYPSQYTVQNPPGHRQYNSSRIDSHRLRQQHRQPRQQRQGAQHTRANQTTRNSVASRRQNQLLHHIENHGLYIPSMSLPKGSMTPLAAIGDYIPSAPSVATTTKTRTKTPAATDSSARTHHAMFATATAAPADNLSTINRRGAPSSQSLSPFEHFIQSYLATQSSSSPDHRHQQFNEFCRATAAYICNGADITRLLPKGFDEKVREAAVTATWTKDDPLESIAVALLEAEENRNDAHFLSKLSLPSWLAVWLSASDKNAKGDWNAVELRLSLLSRDNVERWRAMLPYCAPPAPAQVFPSSMAMDNGGGAGMMGSSGWHDGSQQQEQQQQRQ